MLGIHKRLHKLEGDTSDPLSNVARIQASEFRLICLDQFQVTDIGDALML